jgi:hypothetical protein
MKRILLLIFLFPLISWGQGLSQMGWPASYAELYQKLNEHPEKNYVVIATLTPTKVIDYRTGNGIRDSINHFNFQKDFHPGHQMIGWKCRLQDGEHTSLTGFNGEMSNQIRTMLGSGWGLTSLFATFTDGYIENSTKLSGLFDRVQERFQNGESQQMILTTVIEISEDDCAQLVTEIYYYKDHPKLPATHFSLLARPEEFEGAVCNSFVFYLLSRTQTLGNLAELFSRNIRLPRYLFGRGKSLPQNTLLSEKLILSNREVSGMKVLGSNWNQGGSDGISVNVVDPELVILWQKNLMNAYFKKSGDFFEAKGIEKNLSRGFWEKVEDLYSGQSSNQYVRIDSSLDKKALQVSSNAFDVVSNKNLKFLKTKEFPILIVENNNP